MVSDSERAKILEMIEEGTITAEQGLALLSALGESSTIEDEGMKSPGAAPTPKEALHSDQEKAVEIKEIGIPPIEEETALPNSNHVGESLKGNFPDSQTSEAFEDPTSFEGEGEVIPADPGPSRSEDIKKWKRWWIIPFWVGAGITVIGGSVMYWALSSNGYGFWFACSWFPFLLGVALLALAWSSRTTPWLHVRVHQAPGEKPQKIAISFPIPIRLTAWVLRTFGHYIPHMQDTNLDEVILALKDVSEDETPLFVDVNEGENGEHVQVFIG